MNEKNFHLTKQHAIPHATTTWLTPETIDLITKQIKETNKVSFNSCSDSLEYTFPSPQPVDTECKSLKDRTLDNLNSNKLDSVILTH